MSAPLTVPEAARLLGITERRVRFLLANGKIKGAKIGRDWLVERKSVEERRGTKKGTR